MISFIKNYSIKNIKHKLLILYILNITDIIFTLFLLDTGFYMEANTLMSNAVQSPMASFQLKVILPAALLIFVYFRMQKVTNLQLKQSNYFINAGLLLYTLINISHLIWLALLPIFILVF